MLSFTRLAPVLVALLLAASAGVPAFAVHPAASPSVPAAAPPAQRPPFASSFSLKGAAPGDLPILVTFAIPLRNVGVLDSLVTQVSDPASPLYRHFLTPSEAKSEFLPTAAYSALLNFLQSDGFSIDMTALDSVIVAEATPSQVASVFHTGVDVYSNGTSSYYTTTGGPTFMGAYVYSSNASFLFTRPAYGGVSAPGGNVSFTAATMNMKSLQQVYNLTSLYSAGRTGAGETVGILDYYGSPTIASDLAQYDAQFGLPASTLKITPVGPYDPNLGAAEGWSTEISLDVESAHTMAPGAAIDLYVSNGALPLVVPLAQIVQEHKVVTLSQSFSTPEWYYSVSSLLGGTAFFTLEALLPDQYYALGSLEGISFLASSGDAGGSGYSTGPEGTVGYPASSPFVTSVGGTQTYISASGPGSNASVQTAWSNLAYVPNGVNAGGSTGGVSILEPRPWYQSSQTSPPSYPDGRLVPDIALQAGVDPASLIVDSGQVVGIGGTSESSPLLAGLLAVVAQSTSGPLGLVNPFLYQVGNSASDYAKGFYPISFGYNIPWKASYGYNLVTGWGAPNAGGLAVLLNATASSSGLYIQGEVLNGSGLPQLEYTRGEAMTVSVRVALGGSIVTTGSVSASLQALSGGTAPVPLTYQPSIGNWTGTITMGSQSGLAYVQVQGTSGGASGQAIAEIFAGYLGSLSAPGYGYVLPTDPWSWSPAQPLTVAVNATDLNGVAAPDTSVPLSVESYSISGNSYGVSDQVTLSSVAPGILSGSLSNPDPAGPATLALGGDIYGYAPMVSGVYLQTSYIFPEVAAEPGSASPGQALTIIADPIAPVNVYFSTSYETGGLFGSAVAVGSDVTATLVSPGGADVSTASLYYQSCAQALRVCNGGAPTLYGQLAVPASATPGLYTVMLHSSFTSYTPNGNVTGSFFGQVLVTQAPLTTSVSLSPSTLYMGEKATVVADIAYQNGTEAKFGEFTAALYPASLQGEYTTAIHTAYASSELIQLAYNATLGRWTGLATMPSPDSVGSASGTGGILPSSGSYEIFVTGLTSDGVPTSTAISGQQGVLIQPYLFAAGNSLPSQGSGVAFSGANITSASTLSGDVFAGSNTISGGNVVVSSSQIQGTLTISGANVTLVGVTGGNLVAVGSTITLKDSSLGSLNLTSSTVSLQNSAYTALSPGLPSIAIHVPSSSGVYTGSSVTVSVNGTQVSSLTVSLDGVPIASLVGGQSSYSVPLDASKLADGIHQLTVVATQSDGMAASESVSFASASRAEGLLAVTSPFVLGLIAVAALAAVALVAALVSLRRKGRDAPTATPPPQAPATGPSVPPPA